MTTPLIPTHPKVFPLKQQIQDSFLDYVNNYLTIEKFASDHGITVAQATMFVALGRSVHESIVNKSEDLTPAMVKAKEFEELCTYILTSQDIQRKTLVVSTRGRSESVETSIEVMERAVRGAINKITSPVLTKRRFLV